MSYKVRVVVRLLWSRVGFLGVLIFVAANELALGQSVAIAAGAGEDAGGGSVVIPIQLVSSDGAQPVALQWSWTSSADVSSLSVAAGPEALNADKSIACARNTCLLYGINDNVISDGTVARVTLHTSSHSSFLVLPIQIDGAIAASASGDPIAASSISGSVLLFPTALSGGSATGSVSQNEPAPAANSVSPSGSGGLSQTFSFVFSTGQKPMNLARLRILFGASTAPANSCFITYDGNGDTISLESDDLTSTQSKPAGSSGTIENSQCAIDTTSVIASPASVTLNIGITFKNTFTGRKNIYMYVGDSVDDGGVVPAWEQTGTYTVADPPPPMPSADSVSPDAGNRVSQTFTFVFSDTQNASNLVAAAILFAPALDVNNACYIVFDRRLGTVQLQGDDAMSGGKKPVNSPIPLQNSQCAIGAVSATTTQRSTILGLDITFKNGFAGVKNVYMYGADGDGSINTGWVQKGTWTLY